MTVDIILVISDMNVMQDTSWLTVLRIGVAAVVEFGVASAHLVDVSRTTRFCNIWDIQWSRLIFQGVYCGALNKPENGEVEATGFSFGSISTFFCNRGYAIVGDAISKCQASGRWNSNAPTCSG